MRNFVIIIVGILSAACGAKTDPATGSDSTFSDTTTFIDEKDSTMVATASDAPEIMASLARLMDEHKQNEDSYATLRLSVSGYEYKTDAVWSFDTLMNLVHCYQDWASEGIEGTSDHFFKLERLYAVREENDYDNRKDVAVYHQELGGASFTESESQTDSTLKILDRKFLTDNEQSMKTQLQQIVQLLKDNKSVISSDDPATLHLENNSTDEEMPGTEVTDITIDRKLLEELLK
jgi:hypothetical protein